MCVCSSEWGNRGTFRLWSTCCSLNVYFNSQITQSFEHRYKVRVHTGRRAIVIFGFVYVQSRCGSQNSSSKISSSRICSEIFLERQCRRSSAFFHFVGDDEKSVRNDLAYVFRRLVSRPRLVQTPDLSRSEMFKHSNATKLWQARKISNFEYLMALNTYAGRTHNDPAQYSCFLGFWVNTRALPLS